MIEEIKILDNKATEDCWLAPYIDMTAWIIDCDKLIMSGMVHEGYDMEDYRDCFESVNEWD